MKNKFAIMAVISLSVIVTTSAFASEWSYKKNGDDWKGTCSTGASQSPIDIETSKTVAGDYKASQSAKGTTVNAYNNGHTINFTADGRTLDIVDRVSGKPERFTLVQFHLHNGSEHTVNGKRYSLEAHFVHANDAWLSGDTAAGRLAVIGVLLEEGKNGDKNWSKVLEGDLPHYNGHGGETINKQIDANYYDLLPSSVGAFTYEGSLTTPGCNEVVNWIVMKDAITVSSEAVKNFAASQRDHKTYRNTQPLNKRVVKFGTLVGKKN